MPSDHDRDVLRVLREFMTRVLASTDDGSGLTPLGERISAHLGVDARGLPVVSESVAAHRLVDADLALRSLAQDDGTGTLIGVTGGQQRFHSSLAELMTNPHTRFDVGPVDYAVLAVDHNRTQRVVSFGVWLLRVGGVPAVVVQRAAQERFGESTARLEVMAAEDHAVGAVLDAVRRLMLERSVLRGKVLSFQPTEFGHEAGATFLARPDVPAEAIVLPDGVLDAIVAHVAGIGEHREALLAAGQHLKRGVLLYGPPGTGKTLTVRHLLSRTPGTTAVLLTGSSIRFVTAAAEIARTFQPSIVVLEDIDLVAMERDMTPQPLLFEVLDALDGLDGDADVAFVMTTNRVDVLERALAERPGRVDLAVEVPLPDHGARRRLFAHYAAGLPFTGAALDSAAERAAGVTGSFAKELMRRSVLAAAVEDRPVEDHDLVDALDDLLSARAALTRRLLSGDADALDDVEEDVRFP